jgi:hypothetical protein
MLIKELKNKPHLYLDMDGVQADFFGAWAKTHNVDKSENVPYLKKAIDELAQSKPKKVFDFFANLEPLPGGIKLINWIKTNNIPFTVLSAPLRGPYSKFSILGKKYWLDKYNPGTSKDAIFTSEKYLYSTTRGRSNVLVDDYDVFLNPWIQNKGIAIKHSDETVDNTIEELEKIYFPNK